MSEPNDTAQEGFDQLKRNLEVRYPEDSDLSLDEFLNVESLLALAVRVCGPGADPRKADRLLSNYQLIRPETIGADGHLMQMARRHLFSLASSTAWRRLLGLYERAEYERYRFFDIANGGMALREHPLTGIDRMPIYIDRLLGDVKLSHKNVVARPKGRYSYTCKPEAISGTTITPPSSRRSRHRYRGSRSDRSAGTAGRFPCCPSGRMRPGRQSMWSPLRVFARCPIRTS